MNRPELLAPAGDFASIDAALDHGADAVYVGIGPFNLRAHAANFAPGDLPELLERIHGREKNVTTHSTSCLIAGSWTPWKNSSIRLPPTERCPTRSLSAIPGSSGSVGR